jgi:hypothetical protein
VIEFGKFGRASVHVSGVDTRGCTSTNRGYRPVLDIVHELDCIVGTPIRKASGITKNLDLIR